MSPDPHHDRPGLLALQAALEDLRDGLIELSHALQEHALRMQAPESQAAREEAERLLRRLGR